MIETHFHCLPGVDDGPGDWSEAVALCRLAESEGAHTIVATPHVLREQWINDNPSIILSLVDELNVRLGGHPRVFPGCEAFFSTDLVDLWESENRPLLTLNSGTHLLVEFPAHTVPKTSESVLYELAMAGVTPVIAHPERNAVIASDLALLKRFRHLGAKAQITAGSVVGAFGTRARQAAHQMINEGLVDAVASDAHSILKRPPQQSRARAEVERLWGEEKAASLFEISPAQMIGSIHAEHIREPGVT